MTYPAQLWAAYAAGAVGVRLIGAKLPDQVGPSNLVVPAIGSYALACLISAETTTSVGFLWAGLFAGFGHGYCFPVLTGQVVTRVSENYRGSAMACFTALWEISALTLTPVYGYFADLWGQASMFGIWFCPLYAYSLSGSFGSIELNNRHKEPAKGYAATT